MESEKLSSGFALQDSAADLADSLVLNSSFMDPSNGEEPVNHEVQQIIIETVTEKVVSSLPSEEASSSSAETPSSSSPQGDIAYEPKLDEAVDDETTLEEEERDGTVDDGEVDELERLGEMPLEELMKLYGGGSNQAILPGERVSQSVESIMMTSSVIKSTEDPGEQKISQEIGSGEPSSSFAAVYVNNEEDWSTTDDEDEEDAVIDEASALREQRELFKLLAAAYSGSTSTGDESSSTDDEEFIPNHMLLLKRDVPVGPTHQVDDAEIDPNYDENTCDPDDQILMWAPRVPEQRTKEFLKAAYIQERELLSKEIDPNQLDQSEVADDEVFLKEFLDCNFDSDETLRRCRLNFCPNVYENSKWSEKECEAFEAAIEKNWKRFNIVQTFVPTRTIKEVVDFYYRWKKSPRFEVFLAKVKTVDGKPHDHLEEKIKIRVGKKRGFDAMDAVAEDQLAISESSSLDSRSKRKKEDEEEEEEETEEETDFLNPSLESDP